MAGLATFRQQNPAYANVPDDVLADKLYQKYYSKVPRAEFDKRMGLQTKQEYGPQLPRQEQAQEQEDTASWWDIPAVEKNLDKVMGERSFINKFASEAPLGLMQGTINFIPGIANLVSRPINAMIGETIPNMPMLDVVPHGAGQLTGEIASFFGPGALAKTKQGAKLVKDISGSKVVQNALSKLGQYSPAAETIARSPITSEGIKNALLGAIVSPEHQIRGALLGGAGGAGFEGINRAIQNPWIARPLGAALGGGIGYLGGGLTGAALGAGLGTLARGAKDAPEDFLAYVDSKQAKTVMDAARRQEVHLRPGEATGERNALMAEGSMGFTPEGHAALGKADEASFRQQETAINKLFGDISPVSETPQAQVRDFARDKVRAAEISTQRANEKRIDDFLTSLAPTTEGVNVQTREAANRIVEKQIKQRAEKAAPLYKKAKTKKIEPSMLTSLRSDPLIDDAITYVMKNKAYNKYIKGESDNSIAVLDLAKRELAARGQVGYNPEKPISNTERGSYISSSKRLDTELKRNNKTYREATKAFAEDSPAVVALYQSPIGKMARMSDGQLKNVTKNIFDRSQTDTKRFNEVADRIYKEDPNLWNKIVRSHVENKLNMAKRGDVASIMYDNVFGTARDRQQLYDAVKNNPSAVAQLRNMEINFADNKAKISSMKKTMIGRIANMDDKQLIKLSDSIFDPTQASKKMMQDVRDSIVSSNPESWRALLRHHIEKLSMKGSDKRLTGKNFYDRVLKNDMIFNHLMESANGLPKAQRSLQDMRLIFRNLSNPPTPQALRGAKRASTAESGNRNPIDRFLNMLKGAAYDKELIKIATDPKWDDRIAEVQRVKDPSIQAQMMLELLKKVSAGTSGLVSRGKED